MVGLTIDKRDFNLRTEWAEITLDMGIKIAHLKAKMPEKLLEAYELMAGLTEDSEPLPDIEDSLTEREKTRTLPEFYGKVISILGDIPAKVMTRCMAEDRTYIYTNFCEKIMFGLLYFPSDYEPKLITEFDLDIGRVFDKEGKELKKKYKKQIVKVYLPKSGYGLPDPETGDDEIPMGEEQAVVFTEAADLEFFSREMGSGKFDYAANVCAIMARPKAEEYEEKTSLARAPHFRHIDMGTVWEVFFCFTVHSIISKGYTRISLQEAAKEPTSLGRLLSPRAWIDSAGSLLSRQSQETPKTSNQPSA